MSDLMIFAVWVGFVAIVGWALRNVNAVGLNGEIETVEKIGELDACGVSIATVGGRRMVELLVNQSDEDGDREIYMYLNAGEARLLAEWIALAATPGRTLADARRRKLKERSPA
jgi:hypothetical protein